MAVYTDVPDEELRAFIAEYDIGEVVSCKGIAEGVENSNYLLRTETGIFILTLYEKCVAPADLPFFIQLMEHLASHGIACPTPRTSSPTSRRRRCRSRTRTPLSPSSSRASHGSTARSTRTSATPPPTASRR